jgi:hypothetical protein
MSKNKKDKAKKVFNNVYKKDTNGLFDGTFKSQMFESKTEKEERKRRRTDEWLDYAEEYEDLE